MVLATLNVSIDVPDYTYGCNTDAEDNFSVDEIESVAELVCENVLDIHGQFPDKKNDHSGHRHQLKKNSSIKFNDKRFAFSFRKFRLAEQNLPVFQSVYFTYFTKEILSPPPQA